MRQLADKAGVRFDLVLDSIEADIVIRATGAGEAARSLPHSTPQRLPITIGIGEPFTTTLTVAAYFALLIALPLLIYQLYAFVIPALSPNERGVAKPAMIIAPLLFIAGVVFTYFVVLPPAVHFQRDLA